MSTHSPQFVLNFATGSVSFPLSHRAAQELQATLQGLIQTLRLRASGQLTKHPITDFPLQEDGIRLEVFCNPNIWPTPHAAQLLVTLKTESIRLSTEADLTRVMEDLSQYLQ
jgi:predicted component of type VI protein secretion system